MKVVADTSAFLAVAMNEPEKPWLIATTGGKDLVAPAVFPYEAANALSGLWKRKAVSDRDVLAAWDAIAKIPVELAGIDVRAALALAVKLGCYAYDAFSLQCAMEARCPLLTLDRQMRRLARGLNIPVLE